MEKIDAEHFNELYDIHFAKVYNFVYFRTHHKETAEDLTSKTFIKAWGNLDKFDEEKGSFSTWIYSIARNNIIDHSRKNRNQPESVDLDSILNASSSEDINLNTSTKLELEKIKGYLHTLPDEQRDIILMRVWDDLPFKDISAIIGKSEASCKMVFYRAMEKLQGHFSMTILALLIIKGQLF